MKVFRPFQVEQIDKILRSLSLTGRALLQSATGTGKSLVIVAIAEAYRKNGRILILFHREELGQQLFDRIRSETRLSVGIEQAERSLGGARPDVVLASVPTLANPVRREAFARDEFALVICDECHHFAADSFRGVLDYFTAARLGVTATPDRADGKPLHPIFGRLVARYPMARGMRDGYLAHVRRVPVLLTGLDMTRLRRTGEDFDRAQLEAALLDSDLVKAMAGAILHHSGDRRTVQFCAGVAHSKAVAGAINALAGRRVAASADGNDRAAVDEFRAGGVRVLTNCDLISEGVDIPEIGCVGLPITKSLTRATQTMGRGTRLADGKDGLLVLEFVGGNASDQLSTVDVVGSDLPKRVRIAAEHLLDRQPSLSVLEALDRAASSAGCIATGPARVARAVIDPWKLALSLDGMIMEPARPGAMPATAAQVQLLAAQGLRVVGLDVRQAAMLLAGIQWRRERGRSSPAQALQLALYGFDLECTAALAARKLAQMRVGVAA